MPTSQLSEAIQRLRTMTLHRDRAGLTDAQLLGCFIERRDEGAFEALVRRHGPTVWGVCRRVLGNHHDAEDAFQATFLVLARKAASVRPRELVANWLYGVAYRTALKARSATGRRRARERQVPDMPEPQAVQRDVWPDLEPLLDRELAALPDKYRAAVVLCDLEGKARKEAARQLNIPEGTLSSRLTTARGMLARRLARHGLVLSGGALAGVLSANAASACAPPSAVASATTAAGLFAAGLAGAAGVPSAKVIALAEGVLKTMLVDKLKVATAVLLTLALAGVGARGLARLAAGQPEVTKEEAAKEAKRAGSGPARARTPKAPGEVKSYHCRVAVVRETAEGKRTTSAQKLYWAAPGSWRRDRYAGGELVAITLSHKDKPGLEIDHVRKTYARLEPYVGGQSPAVHLEQLAAFARRADRRLAARKVRDRSAPGFEVDVKKIDPDAGSGKVRVWVDPDSKLPVRVEKVEEPLMEVGVKSYMTVYEDFEWNAPAARWLAPKPPADYEDVTPAPPGRKELEETTRGIVAALKTFAKYSGSKYPQVSRVYPDVLGKQLSDLYKKKGLDGLDAEGNRAVEGLGSIMHLQRHNAGAAYHGRAVGPDDKGKVLLRWKIRGGRFRVIFGDLRVEDVTAARLKALEGR